MKSFDTTFHHAWKQKTHASFFDANALLTQSMLNKIYETKNEVRLLNRFKSSAGAKTLMEVGCATGEFFRYIRAKHPSFKYVGFDISPPAIEKAKNKYPETPFFVSSEDVLSTKQHCANPDIVFCKDVVLHQNRPFEFLRNIVSLPKEAIFLRIRTRDQGATVLDPEQSCQRHYDTWVPYMVLNMDEVLEAIKSTRPCQKIVVQKNYMQLGGYEGRFLPKECYVEATGTSETSIYVEFAPAGSNVTPEVTMEAVSDSRPDFSIFERVYLRLKRQFQAKAH